MDVREKLVELLDDMQRSGTGYFGSAIENKKIADYLISNGVAPVRHARWVKIYENGEPKVEQHQVGVFCSKCMNMPKDRFTESDYCPNCGAKMDEDKA